MYVLFDKSKFVPEITINPFVPVLLILPEVVSVILTTPALPDELPVHPFDVNNPTVDVDTVTAPPEPPFPPNPFPPLASIDPIVELTTITPPPDPPAPDELLFPLAFTPPPPKPVKVMF